MSWSVSYGQQPNPDPAAEDIGQQGDVKKVSDEEMLRNVQPILPFLKKPVNPADASKQADEILKLMSSGEKFDLVFGTGMATRQIPRLGLPQIVFSDASAGLRIDPKKEARIEKTTAFPATQILAATWNPPLASDYGKALGEECRATGVHVLLGPGMNIYRTASCGRNFEYMSEDPYLAARTVEAYVRGMQGVEVSSTLKHYLGNNSEFMRRSYNAVIDERTLREIYTPAFKAGVDAGAWAVMTGYNLVNGTWMSENKDLVAGLLRKDLGFQWLVMTDWNATWHGEEFVTSGVDLEMPWGAALRSVKPKVLGSPAIDRMAHSILKTFIANGAYELEVKKQFTNPALKKFAEHTAVARKVNQEGIVLLKNNGVLPLSGDAAKSVLVTGNFSKVAELSGGGSAHVIGYDSITYGDEAIKRLGVDKVTVVAAPTDEQLKGASAVLIFTGFQKEGENRNRPFQLQETELVNRCVKLNPKTVVFLSCGGGVSNEWVDDAGAVLFGSYGGQTGAPAAFDVLLGAVNPSGKLPFSMEKSFEDSVGFGDDQIKPSEKVSAPSPLFMGRKKSFVFVAGSEDTVHPYDVPYKEGVLVGYRWYDAKNLPVRFPFGHGLSYTTFEYSNLKLNAKDGKVAVEFVLKNSGKQAGAEVAQVYVGDLQCSVVRPPRELKGYRKIALNPGQSEVVSIELGEDAFRFWDPNSKKWTIEPGLFEISIGSSSRDLRLKGSITL